MGVQVAVIMVVEVVVVVIGLQMSAFFYWLHYEKNASV